MAAPADGWRRFLTARLDSLVQTSKDSAIVKVSQHDSVRLAIKRMGKNRILSLPVARDGGDILGFVDLLDVVKFLTTVTDVASVSADDLRALKLRDQDIGSAPISRLMDMSGKDPYVPCHASSLLQQVLPFFATGVHRTVLLSPEDEPVAIFSQSDVVRALAKALHADHAMAKRAAVALKELGLVPKRVAAVSATDRVLSVLERITQADVSVVAVVDPSTGALVAHFSPWDVRGLHEELLPQLTGTVLEFLRQHSPDALRPPLIDLECTLSQAVEQAAERKLHHWLVVDADRKPVGVVTLTDLMGIIRKF